MDEAAETVLKVETLVISNKAILTKVRKHRMGEKPTVFNRLLS